MARRVPISDAMLFQCTTISLGGHGSVGRSGRAVPKRFVLLRFYAAGTGLHDHEDPWNSAKTVVTEPEGRAVESHG